MNSPTPASGSTGRYLNRSGFTFVELIIALAIFATAMSIFAGAVLSVSGEQAVNRENGIAANAASSFIEGLRNEDITQVFALYNTDESDDPGGPGTAPGSRFAVADLDAGNAPDGMVGEVFFPTLDVALPGDPIDLELREDVPNAIFGTPRDLNGDSIIDAEDHTNDYLLLPIQVVLNWDGKSGTRQQRTFATLCQFNWE